MTKCYKLDADLYKFVNDDDGTAELIKGADLAQQKIDAINKHAVDDTEIKKRLEGEIRSNFWEVATFLDQTDVDGFKAYLKTVKQKSEIKLQTGQTIFNQQKYDAAMQARKKEYERVTREANVLLNNPTSENLKRAQELMQQRKEIENTRILKDAAQFYDPEYVTIRMAAIEALSAVQNKLDDWRKDEAAAKQNALDAAIANERNKFKGISESDFQLLKQLKRLMNSQEFYNAFADHHVWDRYRDVWGYDSLEDFFNRERNLHYESPELQFNDTDKQAINYMRQLIRDYKTQREYERLKAEVESSATTM